MDHWGARSTGKADHWGTESIEGARPLVSGEAHPLVSGGECLLATGGDGPAETSGDGPAGGEPSGCVMATSHNHFTEITQPIHYIAGNTIHICTLVVENYHCGSS